MAEYISKKAVLEHLDKCKNDPLFDPDMARICFAMSIFVKNMKAADVQPLSVISVHLKSRLYEIALNINDEKAKKIIADIAEQIDLWLNEVKDGEK